MEQMQQKDVGALDLQAVSQKDVEQACFHTLGLISRNCEYLEQHLAHTGADSDSCQAVEDIGAAAARLDRTINEVLTLLEDLRAKELPQLHPMDLCSLLQQITAQADMIQAQLKVELTLDCGGWTTCRVMADRGDAELLLLHLLSNALKFTPAGGTITVELKKSGETLRLTVSDTGCGIPPERMAHLFDGCFQPGHPSPAPYGLGLGLPLCRAIAEKHGGSITVESAPGKGSRFMVSLPDRQLGSQLSDIPSVYNGGFSRPLLGLADALPSDAFAVRNLE